VKGILKVVSLGSPMSAMGEAFGIKLSFAQKGTVFPAGSRHKSGPGRLGLEKEGVVRSERGQFARDCKNLSRSWSRFRKR